MRIALVRRVCSLKKAGAERYCINLMRQLKSKGHDVTIVGESMDESLKSEAAHLRVPVVRWTSWTKNSSLARNAHKVFENQGFDIVHGLSRVYGLDTYRLTDPLQTHWLNVFYRGPWTQALQRLNPRHRTILGIEKQLFGPQGPRRIIVQSKLDERLLQEYFGIDPARIRRVSNGVDTKVFHPDFQHEREFVRDEWKIPHDAPLLTFASMDFRRKGLASLLTAISRAKTSGLWLMVIGDGDIARFKTMAQQLGLGDRLVFTGRQQQIARLYAASDLFVLPTIYEPFPNVNLEAMACGVPVLTTSTAGGADVIEPAINGYVVSSPDEIDCLADRIDFHFGRGTTQLKLMSAAARSTAQRHTPEVNAERTLAVFQEVLGEKKAAA
jgi:UDP-glucose:(heptosyl)LPS alpha-1,3-glucosyltransferase